MSEEGGGSNDESEFYIYRKRDLVLDVDHVVCYFRYDVLTPFLSL